MRSRSLLFPLLLAGLLLLLTGSFHGAAQVGSVRHVVVISIDGLGPEYYLHPEQYGLKLPVIEELRDKGSFAWAVIPQYPSVTYPSHTSMMTGVRPATHGIVYNTIFDPLKGSTDWYLRAADIKVPALWDLVHTAGLTSGAVGWPVTVGARIDYLIPEIYPAPKGQSMLEAVRTASTPGLVDRATAQIGVDIVDRQYDPIERDRFNATAAAYIIRQYKPNLTLLHLAHTDSAQHDFGKHAAEVLAAFRLTDSHIGEILRAVDDAGIRASTTIVITGDHGFYQVHSAMQPNVILRQAGLLQTDASGNVINWKAAAHSNVIRLADPRDDATAKKVTDLFRNLSETTYRGLFQVVDRKMLDSLGAYPEALLAIEPVEGYTVTAGVENDSFVVATKLRGAHGYLPTVPGMQTGLIMAGNGVRPGVQIPLARQIDIAPTIAQLLGISMKNIEGVPLVGLLEK